VWATKTDIIAKMDGTQKRLGVGVIIINHIGEYLLHLRDEKATTMTSQWSLVGGGVDENETPETAAIREVMEETNLKAENLKFFKKIDFSDMWDAMIFTAEVDTSNQKLKLNEGKKLKFFSKVELRKLLDSLDYSNPFLGTVKEHVN
jgi:mutator protein MutT